ncbi:hypothetical protein [Psychroserpens sp.]|uniref:tetratricopeptide repeat protein n=1 Tax=Psychroserpens sp. TaxID=2020870 RepID=UPI001B2677FF|nr:hypothetical protein [Psychroserpens sp.]MBO6607597.1 hypothetical protein [Psychroserpens sp.]MBO6631571.1 hypothetical protein [Psychroserpens sp.]MBO6655091.1 hypothetical protein [Psychroserpens sp.]MBO6683104.1 hypothetical protein [Psychroserpens sp.]MBO6749717.1 hypothetical protein [Psychroserpens sp.]
MRLKQLKLFFWVFIIGQLVVVAQNKTPQANDTIGFSEANTEKVIALGSFLEQSIHENDVTSFLSKLNEDLFFERILSHNPTIDMKDSFVKGFLFGMKQSLDAFPDEIISEVANGAYYDFISYRYDSDDGTYYALFRLYSSETGMNYHDFRICKSGDEFKFSDMYTYLTGEHFTQTLGRMMNYTLPEKKSSKKRDRQLSKDYKAIFKALMYNDSGKYTKAYDELNNLKSEVSKEKFLQILKVLIASNIDEDKYLKSLEELMATHFDDPTIALNKIDYHIYKEEYFEAIQVINQLQNETDDDFLNYLKACVAFEDQNYDLALNMFQYTAENYVDFFDGQAGYLNTLVMMKNYDDAVTYLEKLVADGYDKPLVISYIEEDDEYGNNILSEFAASTQFTDWKKK